MRIKSIMVPLCVAAIGGAAVAQLDWAFISTAGDPDPVTAFDLSNPGASNTNIGFVDGNFNRSMDFYSFDAFYYFVSTDALNDPGDRGLWRWDNGVNTQLTTIGFSDSGDGDGTYSNGTYYVSVDDGDATSGDSIYAFSNLNGAVTFTEIGETGLTQLIGLAIDPTDGTMYGYDSATESLYTISTTDGTPTLVGASGMTLGAIGGMDFNANGSTLLLSSGDDLFTVSTSDGLLASAGNIGLNSSALSFRVPTPGAAAILGAGGLLVLRRRR